MLTSEMTETQLRERVALLEREIEAKEEQIDDLRGEIENLEEELDGPVTYEEDRSEDEFGVYVNALEQIYDLLFQDGDHKEVMIRLAGKALGRCL